MVDEDWYHEYASGTMVAEELQIYPGPETPEGFEVTFSSRSTSEHLAAVHLYPLECFSPTDVYLALNLNSAMLSSFSCF